MKKLLSRFAPLLAALLLSAPAFGQLTPGSPISSGAAVALTPNVQGAGTNFLTSSGILTNTEWALTNVTIPATTVSPIETGTTPSYLQMTVAGGEIAQTITAYGTSNPVVNDAVSVASAYFTVYQGGALIANASQRVTMGVRFVGGGSKTFSVTFNPANGQIISSAGTGVTVSVQTIPEFDSTTAGTINIWYRIGLGVKNFAPYSAQATFFINPAAAALTQGSTVIAYGPQLETPSGPTGFTTALKTNPNPSALIVSAFCGTSSGCLASTIPPTNVRSSGSLPRQSVTDTQLFSRTIANLPNYDSSLNGTSLVIKNGGGLNLTGSNKNVANGEYITLTTFPNSGAATISADTGVCIISPATWVGTTSGNSITMPANAVYKLTFGVTSSTLTCTNGIWTLTDTYAGGTTPSGTIPAPGGAGTIIRSDGTNWAVSQDTWPDLIASGNVVFATAANTVGSNAAFTWASNFLTTPNIRVGDGTTAAPSMAFSTQTGTGFHYLASNWIIADSGGTDSIGINSATTVGLQVLTTLPIGWGSLSGVNDTGLSRISAGVVGVGTGAAGSVAGTVSAKALTLNATAATNSQGISQIGSTTGAHYNLITNTGSTVILGSESSTGGNLVSGSAAYAGVIGTQTNTELDLITNSTIRMTISGAGTVSMPGLTTSSAATTGTVCWTTGSGLLNVDTTTTCLLSSGKFKENDRPITNGLDSVMALRPVAYTLKKEYNPTGLGEQIGFYAEDVARVDPRLVSLEADGTPHAVRYQQMTALFASAIQEQQGMIESLRKEVAQLRSMQYTRANTKPSFESQPLMTFMEKAQDNCYMRDDHGIPVIECFNRAQ